MIDECLSPTLTEIGLDEGFECTHVTWRGRRGAKDWQHVQDAVNGDWVLVTNDTTDFVTLVGREEIHPGLVCLKFAEGNHNSRESQRRLFRHALEHLADRDPVNEVLEITLDAEDRVRVTRFAWPT